jgi:hypothetical protein
MQPVKVWNLAVPPDHYGTVGCLVRWGGNVGLLSASHVLAPIFCGVSVGANLAVSVLADGNTSSGELAKCDVPMTIEGGPVATSRDAAFATVDAASESSLIATQGLPAGVRLANQYGQEAHFFGASSGTCKRTVIHDIAGRVSMRYRLYDNDKTFNYSSIYVPLSGLIQCDANEPVVPGDSGCLLFDSDGYGLGLLIGTDPTETYPYYTHLQPILDLFGVQLVTTANYPQAPRLKDLI